MRDPRLLDVVGDGIDIGCDRLKVIVVRNRPPTAAMTYAPLAPMSGDSIALASISADSDGPLVAQDWGGTIRLGALLAARERFERIVLFNTGAFRPWFIPWRIRACRVPLLGRLAVQGANAFSLAALRMTLATLLGGMPRRAVSAMPAPKPSRALP